MQKNILSPCPPFSLSPPLFLPLCLCVSVANMRFTKYSKWTGQSWDDISLEELMEALSDYLLRSGFEDQFRRHYRRWSQDWGHEEFDDLDADDALERLRRAIRDA